MKRTRQISLVLLELGVVSFGADAQDHSPSAGSLLAVASPCTALGNSSAGATPSAGQAVSTSGSVAIVLIDQGFPPSYVESTNGHPPTITLTNTDNRPHGFTM